LLAQICAKRICFINRLILRACLQSASGENGNIFPATNNRCIQFDRSQRPAAAILRKKESP